jgi:hypothetical protein
MLFQKSSAEKNLRKLAAPSATVASSSKQKKPHTKEQRVGPCCRRIGGRQRPYHPNPEAQWHEWRKQTDKRTNKQYRRIEDLYSFSYYPVVLIL